MTASAHRFDCAQLGLCQHREPPCPGCSQSLAWREPLRRATGAAWWINPATGVEVLDLPDQPPPIEESAP
jgi:hypothetical protein